MKLSRLEHLLLGTMCNEMEPLHALYADSTKEIEGVTVEGVIDGLLHLCQLGLARPYFYSETTGKYEPLAKLAREELLKHCAGRTGKELGRWPDEAFKGEYFFEITEKGREEEAREVYSEYYSDADIAG